MQIEQSRTLFLFFFFRFGALLFPTGLPGLPWAIAFSTLRAAPQFFHRVGLQYEPGGPTTAGSRQA